MNQSYPKNNKKSKKKLKITSIFDIDDDDDDDNNNEDTNIYQQHDRNKELIKEQNALRKRNQSNPIYNYDDDYEQFKSHDKPKTNLPNSPKKSRYISNLLKHAEKRQHERDRIYERKIAKEQQEENSNNPPTEKFITSAYKQKLKERQLWQEQQDQQDLEDERKQKLHKGSISNFYSQLHNNVAVGGGKSDQVDNNHQSSHPNNSRSNNMTHYESTSTYKSNNQQVLLKSSHESNHSSNSNQFTSEQIKAIETAKIKSQRFEKLAAARERYFQRKKMQT